MKRTPIFCPPPIFTLGVVFGLLVFGMCGTLEAQEYTWTGGGADSLFTTADNWGGSNVFTNNGYALTHNNNASITATLPAGTYAQTNGFDITNATIVVAGELDSIRAGSHNGFWMRGGSTITFLSSADFAFLNQSGNVDQAQITMAAGNNTINKYDSSALSFGSIYISSFDCGGGFRNILNQYAGGVTATNIYLGTCSTNFSAEPSQYNLYGGTVSTGTLRIQLDTDRSTQSSGHGRGELNIYGGTFTAGTLSGGQSTSGSTTYTGDINIHLNQTYGYGTFSVTGNSDYNGNVNVKVDSPILTLSPSVLGASLVSFGGSVSTDMTWAENPLISVSADNVAQLNESKNVTPDGGYTVGTALTFDTVAREGYLSISSSGDPYVLTLSTTEFENEADMAMFTSWLNENVENYDATPIDLSSLQLSTFAANAATVFLWDFSGYTAKNVGVLGIATQHVPEPASWILILWGIAFCWRKRVAQTR
ncbi:MAG: hypothetical protein Q4D98_10510 [Planctomycetia bacterium]|nr:hypothetical protein [Planctomycetia bacterium]